MAAAPGNRGERPNCRFCDRPATQLAHPGYKALNHKHLKEIRQPAALSRSPEHAVCDSHLDSAGKISSIKAGLMPDPKSEVSCSDCGEKMRNLEMDSHADLHKLGREVHSMALKETLNNSIENRKNMVKQDQESHAARVEQLRNLGIKLANYQDQIETGIEQHHRKDWPNTGEDYGDHY
jgi:hypothetical protein